MKRSKDRFIFIFLSSCVFFSLFFTLCASPQSWCGNRFVSSLRTAVQPLAGLPASPSQPGHELMSCDQGRSFLWNSRRLALCGKPQGLSADGQNYAQEVLGKKEREPAEYKFFQRIMVPGNVNWTETKLDVEKGQEVYFQASGNISLQIGNPMANCGPEGLNLKSMQQPLLDQNFGALIGKVVIEVTFTVDKETKEKTRHEKSEIFFIGAEKMVLMPASGSLWLGINENIVGDNEREFIVTIYLR